MIKVSSREAHKIAKRLGLTPDEDTRTFYAYDEMNDEIYEFDFKKERDAFIDRANNRSKERI